MTNFRRMLSLVLALVMVLSCVGTAFAAETESVSFTKIDNDAVKADLSDRLAASEEDAPLYESTDVVRVSIVLEGESTIKAGYSTSAITENTAAMAYRASLKETQKEMENTISKKVLGGKKLDVVWNLTLAANIISANVAYGKIEQIKAIEGVKDVVIETQYAPDVASTGTADPNMATSPEMVGSAAAYLEGYTGAGGRVAIIDTGVDTDHQSFDAGAFEYSLQQNAAEKGMEYEAYVESLDLLDVAEITTALEELNIVSMMAGSNLTATDLYHNTKIPFGFNYVDLSLRITHDGDTQGSHGSHVSGIAAANAYIPNGDSYENALESVLVQGVAPDAQIITMKVFGSRGGAYDSDYMAAIEDAIVLNCDSVNLSLGSANPGRSRNETYQEILDSLTESDTVVVMSAGNNGSWADNIASGMGYLYADDVSMDTNGSPGSYTNSLAVASVDNIGYTGKAIDVAGHKVVYTETTEYSNAPITTLDTSEDGSGTELDYIFFVNNFGADENGASTISQYADVAAGKVVFVSRGTSSFFQKHEAAAAAGGIACVVYNNQPGVINMDLTDSRSRIPCVSITQDDAVLFTDNGTAVADEEGNVLYYTGKLTIADKISASIVTEDYVMSAFSAWGVPGSLELKPEITAPGGNIYSINGVDRSGTAYEVMSGTSMAAPQVTGMVALVAQYIEEHNLTEGTDLTVRALAQSLLMSTAVPVIEKDSGSWYSVMKQGAGVANVGNAVTAESYILVEGQNDGKVKVELYDDADRNGTYTATFSINNITDEAVTYNLSADFFTQDIFSDGVDLYLDTWTAALQTVAEWTVDGKAAATLEDVAAYDFDNDGDTDQADAQALMELVTGEREEIANAEYADLDGNGSVETADVYELLKLVSAATVTVPASGSVEVTVTFSLTEAEKAFLDTYYTNGAYVEGYLFVTPEATAEGVSGTTHSIPVFGFYGNWSDPSMYDVGSLVEYWYGTEMRYPYLPDSTGYPEMFTNYMTIKYAGETSEYYYFGNPLADDDAYIPERNGFNNLNGDILNKYYFAVIRNAGNAKFVISDVETGEVYMEQELGEVDSAFYYESAQAWQGTQYSLNLGWKGTDAAGKALPEGTSVNISLVLAPEYYANEDGTYDWDALGEGAYLTTMATIDNTAPEILEVYRGTKNRELIITAQDNEYISVIAVYDETGTEPLEYIVPNQMVAGEEQIALLDLSKIADERMIVTVYDYAMNASTYKIIYGEDENSAVTESIALNPTELTLYAGSSAKITAATEPWIVNDPLVWTSSDDTVATVTANGLVTGVGKGECVITATSALNPEVSATCDVTVLTVDYTINGLLQDEDGDPMSFTWNLAEDKTWNKVADLETSIGTAALAGDGDVYVMDAEVFGTYKVDFATGETVASGELSPIPYWDLATSTVFTLMDGSDLLHGIYAGYLFPLQDPMALTSYGYNLGSALAMYTGASYLVAIESAGLYYDAEDGCYAELIYALDNAGYLWIFEYTEQDSFYLFNFYPTTLDVSFNGYEDFMYCSLVEANDGSAMFLSHFDGNTNNIYMLEPVIEGAYIASFDAKNVGNVGDGVWPAPLTSVTANGTDAGMNAITDMVASANLPKTEIAKVEASEIAAVALPVKGNLNAVSANVEKSEKFEDPSTATVTITADEAMNNGLYEITYDAEKVELVAAESNMDVYSFNMEEGKVTFGFASLTAANADDVLATLTFKSVEPKTDSTVTVAMPELDAEPVSVEIAFACDHAETEVRDAKDATCTETGYTGDTWCLHCGEKLAEGTEIEALGHTETEVRDAKDATCTEAGYTGDTWCLNCGEKIAEGTEIEALGHTYGEWVVTTPATMTAAGVETRVCSACDEVETREIPAEGALAGDCLFADFTDCKDAWYHEAVDFAVANGLMNGVGEHTFAPGATLTRGMMVTVLYRAAGSPEVTEACSFTDVDANEWYADAIAWAQANGIVSGVTETTFAPEQAITREQIATILWRNAGEPKVEGDLSKFKDTEKISDYAVDAMAWAVAEGIFQGDNTASLNPTAHATRAEFACIIMRYLDGAYDCEALAE